MKYQRDDDEVLDISFVRDYLGGRITFYPLNVIPEIFEEIIDALGDDYGYTNALQDNSCLVVPHSAEIGENVLFMKAAKKMTVYVEGDIDNYVDLMLTKKGRDTFPLIFRARSDDDYYDIGRRVAQDSCASVLLVRDTNWDNTHLQRSFLQHKKHYCIALPQIAPVNILLSYYDPHRWG